MEWYQSRVLIAQEGDVHHLRCGTMSGFTKADTVHCVYSGGVSLKSGVKESDVGYLSYKNPPLYIIRI